LPDLIPNIAKILYVKLICVLRSRGVISTGAQNAGIACCI
jgi:hypothetical protein